jgi:hypothetical protein
MREKRKTRRRRGNGQYVNIDRRVDPDEARQRLRERDARAAADTRSEAQCWLGDPPPGRSALTQSNYSQPQQRGTSWRVDLWRR